MRKSIEFAVLVVVLGFGVNVNAEPVSDVVRRVEGHVVEIQEKMKTQYPEQTTLLILDKDKLSLSVAEKECLNEECLQVNQWKEAIDILSREVFAQRMEYAMVSSGYSMTVWAHNQMSSDNRRVLPGKRVLIFRYPLMTKALAWSLVNSKGAREMAAFQGFEEIRFTDGGYRSWSYPLDVKGGGSHH